MEGEKQHKIFSLIHDVEKLVKRLYFKVKVYQFYNKKTREEKDWISFLTLFQKYREILEEDAYKIVEKYNVKRRLEYLKRKKKEIEKAKISNPIEAITKIFYEEYLGCKFDGLNKDSMFLVERNEENIKRIIYFCGNDCPILKYSTKLGINPLPICKKSYERGAEVFLQELMKILGYDVDVVYTRDYNSLRPSSLFCKEEIIFLKRKTER